LRTHLLLCHKCKSYTMRKPAFIYSLHIIEKRDKLYAEKFYREFDFFLKPLALHESPSSNL
jgi:hypothetical protein